MKNLLALATLLTSAYSRLVVYGPEGLKKEFKKSDGIIEASYSNFGKIPYGQSIIGRIYHDADNADGCKRGEFTQDFSGDPDDILTPIYLVYRGNCTFVQKTRNIANAQGALAVIIDNKPFESIESVIMSDDSTGMGISIPAMLISSDDGEKLVQYLKTAPEEEQKKAALAAEFIMEHPDNRVEYDIWYTSFDDRARDFIRDFKEYNDRLGKKVLMTPHFVNWPCTMCDESFKSSECVSGGQYCASPHKWIDNQAVKGRDILMEDIREKCIYNLYYEKNPSVWWKYMKHVHSHCYKQVNVRCSRNAHNDLGLDFQKTLNCQKESFSGQNYENGNSMLKQESEYWSKNGAGFYPAIVINNRTYRGDISPDDVF